MDELRIEPAFLKANGDLTANAATVLFDYNNIIQTILLTRAAGATERFTINDLINDIILNEEESEDSPRIIIISVTDQTKMITIATRIIDTCLFRRRRNPNFNNEILFIFDEAHEYISTAPQEQNNAVRMARTSLLRLARQGRKYGLGLCISTQRTRYLDTTIMGQIHTLFAGYLPRKTDREPLIEAFDIDEEIMKEVKNFGPGQWLLCSAIAVGLLRSVPMYFQAYNTEDDLKLFFKNHGWLP